MRYERTRMFKRMCWMVLSVFGIFIAYTVLQMLDVDWTWLAKII